jgi:hypothetical protein
MQVKAIKPFIDMDNGNRVVEEGEIADLTVKQAEKLIKNGIVQPLNEQENEPKRNNRRDRNDDGGNFGN